MSEPTRKKVLKVGSGLGTLAMMTILAHAAAFGAYQAEGELELPGPPGPRPPGYGVHLSKTERRGRSYAELQALRAERARG